VLAALDDQRQTSGPPTVQAQLGDDGTELAAAEKSAAAARRLILTTERIYRQSRLLANSPSAGVG
jgi:hypothetical protein